MGAPTSTVVGSQTVSNSRVSERTASGRGGPGIRGPLLFAPFDLHFFTQLGFVVDVLRWGHINPG